jgi:hypothetical protein
VAGAFVAAAVVALAQFLRTRERRLLLLAALFGFQAQALSREWYDVWRDVFQSGACAAGLALVLALSPRTAPPSPPLAAPSPPTSAPSPPESPPPVP